MRAASACQSTVLVASPSTRVMEPPTCSIRFETLSETARPRAGAAAADGGAPVVACVVPTVSERRRVAPPSEAAVPSALRCALRRCRILSVLAMQAAWWRRRIVSSRRLPTLHEMRFGVASIASISRDTAGVEMVAFCDAKETSVRLGCASIAAAIVTMPGSVRALPSSCSAQSRALPRIRCASASAFELFSPIELSLSVSMASPARASRPIASDLAA
mmetsp:Transcript_45725/g.148640  ORF Transcript_45725/g.148640 Transcript_45725/m.148640 type:complete len:218 (-) Transcript_45725:382-1035(-)